MPDTQMNQAAYPQSGEQQPGLGFPLAMLVALISLSTGAVLRWASGPCRGKGTGEQALFRELMPHLSAGDIIVVDRYHCTYFTVAMLCERGVDILTRQHQRRLTDFRQGQRLGPRDRLVTWQRPQRPQWMDQVTYARMPEQLSLRQTKVAGRVLVTTLSDARSVTPLDLDTLYRSRWHVEVDLRSIKAVIGMDILRAKSPDMIAKEMAVHLLAYNLVRGLMARAGAGAETIARAEFQGHAATAVGVSTTSALGREQISGHHERAPARRDQRDDLARSARTRGATCDKTKTETPCFADSTSPCRACRDHPCALGLCLR